MSDSTPTTPPTASGGGTAAACTTEPCPNCVYWNQDHTLDYSGPDSKFVTSTQIRATDVAFRLEANLAAGNIKITSIFRWGTVAEGITDAEKANAITVFKQKVGEWGGRFSMRIIDPICGTKTLPVQFRLLWSPGDTTDTAPYRVNLHRTYPRAAVTGFDIDIGYDTHVTGRTWSLIHEYGHTLGLQDEYFYAGVTSATVTYKKADGSTERVELEPGSPNLMSRSLDTTFLNRFFYLAAIQAQELLRTQSGRNVTCEIV